MSGIIKWAPHTWVFFHTFAAHINEDFFSKKKKIVLFIIKIICHNLPCNICTQHATNFMNRVNENTVKSKKDLIKMLYVFHNSVNKRTGKPVFPEENLNIYNTYRMDFALIHFLNGYKAIYGSLMSGRLSNWTIRNRIKQKLINWMKLNWAQF